MLYLVGSKGNESAESATKLYAPTILYVRHSLSKVMQTLYKGMWNVYD
jgi:hypothetical protein